MILHLSRSASSHAYGSSLYGNTGQPIGFSNFQCTGDEANLGECTSNTSLPSTCNISTLAGVKCTPKGTCETAGFTSCCNSTTCNNGGCYCDSACYNFNDCCFDDIGLTCPQGGGGTSKFLSWFSSQSFITLNIVGHISEDEWVPKNL